MAQRTITTITDDIDGSPEAKPYTFAWQGTSYEIDLGDANRDAFLKALEPYINAGRKVTRSRARGVAARGGTGDAAEIREWAKANGFEVTERGRISREVRAAFFKARTGR